MSVITRDLLGHLVSSVWTNENIATLRRMHAAGKSGSQIGKELGCSRNAVIGKLHRLRIKDRDRPLHLQKTSLPSLCPIIRSYNHNPLGGNNKRRKKKPAEPRPISVSPHAHGFKLNPNKVRPRGKPKPVANMPSLGPVLFLDRPIDRCAFIADDPKLVPAAELLVCGESVKLGSSYCPAHFRLTSQRYEMRVAAATFVGRAA